MKSEIVGSIKSDEKPKFPRLVIDHDGMVVLRINADTCLTVNAGNGSSGSWRMFDNYSRWDFDRMKDFDGVIQLSND